MFDVCVIGHLTTDFLEIDGKTETAMPGGTAFYTSMALRSLGLNVAVITRLSVEDRAMLLGGLEIAGIHVFAAESRQTTVFENIYSRGNLNSRFQRIRSVASPFSFDDLADRSASIFHIGPLTNLDISADFLAAAAAKGQPISLDIQGCLRDVTQGEVRLIDWPEKEKGLAFVDILKTNEEEARILSGETDVNKAALTLAEIGPKEVIITQGNRGSTVFSGHDLFHIPAFPVKQIIDPTGCGDTFMAGYLGERLKSHDITRAGRFAAYLASLKLERFGALQESNVNRRT
jgi:sugar/nucleoside kinase (ribokinase family)